MIASLVFATFICTLTPDNTDKCETSYLKTWENVSQYHADKVDCEAELAALFPDDIRVNPVTKQYQFGGCYRVLPGESVGMPKEAVYMQNLQDADDSFTDYRFKLQSK